MNRSLSFSIILFLIASSAPLFGQGCSDAGFCTMGAMKPDQPFNKRVQLKLKTMEVSFYRGSTSLTPIIYVANMDFNFALNSRNAFQVKVPYQWVTGQLANTQSIGDISLCYTRNIYSSDRFDLNLSFGAKLPTNNSNTMAGPNPLPMYYQTSLGTYDAIAGISLINRKWLFATGIQVPLNQNGNKFDWHRWISDDPAEQEYIQRYPNSTDLFRGIDVMLRVERNFRLSRFNFSVGLLPIYRIRADVITNFNGVRTSVDAKGNVAKGLALSWIVTTGYNFNARSSVRLLVGHKIEQREFSPDGLTRELVSSLSYAYRF
ncbi:MAG: hypothetical protein JNK10_14230 [Cyclobacteriaceae bacterium]|nr:hypothetical protein [Cyclobacteriaceae bacterium]